MLRSRRRLAEQSGAGYSTAKGRGLLAPITPGTGAE